MSISIFLNLSHVSFIQYLDWIFLISQLRKCDIQAVKGIPAREQAL